VTDFCKAAGQVLLWPGDHHSRRLGHSQELQVKENPRGSLDPMRIFYLRIAVEPQDRGLGTSKIVSPARPGFL
jgi:hypothetical protein